GTWSPRTAELLEPRHRQLLFARGARGRLRTCDKGFREGDRARRLLVRRSLMAGDFATQDEPQCRCPKRIRAGGQVESGAVMGQAAVGKNAGAVILPYYSRRVLLPPTTALPGRPLEE